MGLPTFEAHAEVLLPMIEAVRKEAGLDYADLDRIGVTVGPGTFAGTRIGLAAARGMALAGGLTVIGVSTLEAVAQGLEMAEDEAAVHRFASELHRDGDVSDAAFDEAKRLFGEQGVAELLGLCGYYTAVGLTLNVARVPLPDGVSDPFGASR